jgi:anaerobic ribonucleoside-triphosphate reductase activating protein
MTLKIRISHITRKSYVDGPGERDVLFVQGCENRCPGCQNKALQDLAGGAEVGIMDLALELAATGRDITISGGEPMLQAQAVANLLARLRALNPNVHVIVYTGFTFERLVKAMRVIKGIHEVLSLANVIVDGPYIAELDNDLMQWRGSSNQRPINLMGTHWVPGEVFEIVEEDWDAQVFTITDTGDVLGTAGQMETVFDAHALQETRMCGQTAEL